MTDSQRAEKWLMRLYFIGGLMGLVAIVAWTVWP